LVTPHQEEKPERMLTALSLFTLFPTSSSDGFAAPSNLVAGTVLPGTVFKEIFCLAEIKKKKNGNPKQPPAFPLRKSNCWHLGL